jgi:hypothetical protein
VWVDVRVCISMFFLRARTSPEDFQPNFLLHPIAATVQKKRHKAADRDSVNKEDVALVERANSFYNFPLET